MEKMDCGCGAQDSCIQVKMKEVISADDVVQHYNNLKQSAELKSGLKVLIDCTTTRFDIKVSELTEIKISLDELLEKKESVVEAILVSQPYETAIIELFAYRSRSENYDMKAFFTEKEAREWLQSKSKSNSLSAV